MLSNSALQVTFALAAIASGFMVSVFASRRAVSNTEALVAGTRLPRFLVGFTLLAIGTDLPEMVNSIVASLAGKGDLNVGDSVGSAVTQATLILGLLPLFGGAFLLVKRRVGRIGVATVSALLLGVLLMSDGTITRVDALILIGFWAGGSALIWGPTPPGTQESLPLQEAGRVRKGFAALGALAIVALGTTAAVWGMSTLADTLSIPEYIVAFFLAAIGTSLPELVVTLTAIRRGQKEMAIGNALGATFIDSTLSIGIGPLIAPVLVTPSLAVVGSIGAAVAIAVVAGILALRGKHDWRTGILFIVLYLAFYVLLLGR